MSDVKKLIEKIGGRERLEEMFDFFGLSATHGENRLMARALLEVLDAKPVGEFYEFEPGDWYQRSPGDKGVKKWTPLYKVQPAASVPDGLAAAVNRLLDVDGSRGTFDAIIHRNALAEVERLLAAAPGGEV